MQSPMEELRDTLKQIWRTFPEDSIHYKAAINAALIRFEIDEKERILEILK